MDAQDVWDVWTLLAMAGRTGGPAGEAPILQEVAIRFGDRFTPADRTYHGGEPSWHGAVRQALVRLRAQGLARGSTRPVLTAAGATRARDLAHRRDPPGDEPALGGASPDDVPLPRAVPTRGHQPTPPPGSEPPIATPGVIAPPLREVTGRQRMGFPLGPDARMPVMVALNLRFAGGPHRAVGHLARLWFRVTGGLHPAPLAGEYVVGDLSMNEIKRLVAADTVETDPPRRSIHRIWPDFPVSPQIHLSASTIKVDAARRTFNARGERIVWAVVDSGIDAGHPHFASYATLTGEDVKDLHRAFPSRGEPVPDGALVDETGHGTHVAGIIGGGLDGWLRDRPDRTVQITENRFNIDDPNEPLRVPGVITDPSGLAGMAPCVHLVSLKVLQRGGGLEERVSRVIRALAYVRQVNSQSDRIMRIHGVNLSVGYEFDPEWFACGQSPLCREVDKLVRSGVVVVTAAGNSGYGSVGALLGTPARFTLGMTINDPGNADRAITVGSTHREMPHTYGVSYFSSKGPTGDGRVKPDLVAPGERIVSCAAGEKLATASAGYSGEEMAVYVEETGTSMAAPHVSGAIAAFLSARREFIGQPEKVKRIMLDAAVPLGRDRHFQGHGLIDLMRALQAV